MLSGTRAASTFAGRELLWVLDLKEGKKEGVSEVSGWFVEVKGSEKV